MFVPKWLLTLVVAAALAASAHARDGVRMPTKEQYERMPEWKAPSYGFRSAPQMDLREYLPQIGDQGQQGSCTGWAVAYAARSAMEARDRGWKADRRDRQFSPSFIYNSINGGRDMGSSIVDAFRLMQERGTATLATMPYSHFDFQTQPSREAFLEAARYRIGDVYALRSGAEVRQALQARNPVVLGIVTEPNFMSGNFDVYTPALQQQGLRYADRNAPHEFHAICAVGYDDQRRAFLLMNSWGPRWGHSGYCWVSYDLMDAIGPAAGRFCRGAFVMTSASPPVREDAPISVEGSAWHGGQANWGWKLSIAAPSQALRDIAEVRWVIRAPDGATFEARSTEPANRFEVGGSVRQAGKYSARGTVHFRSGANEQVAYELQAVAPAQRALRLSQSDRFFATIDQRRVHLMTVRLEGNLADLAEVKAVTYRRPAEVSDRPEFTVTGDAQNGFACQFRITQPFVLRASVRFADGTTQQLELPLRLTDAVRNELKLTNTSRLLGPDPQDPKLFWYAWSARITGPEEQMRRIKFVRYYLHPTFNEDRTNPKPVDVDSAAEYGFPFSTWGWGVFELKARVFFQDGATADLSHMLKFGEQNLPPQRPEGLDPGPDDDDVELFPPEPKDRRHVPDRQGPVDPFRERPFRFPKE